jgi:hypothetical protein
LSRVEFDAVVVQKADLDTVCAGFLLGCTSSLPVVHVDDVAPRQLLDDPTVLCLECGGAGEVQLGNFDHHDPDGPTETAAEQAWAAVGQPARTCRLVRYVALHDRGMTENASNPRLSLIGLFSAMREVVHGEVARFQAGLSLLEWFIGLNRDPCGSLVHLDPEEPRFDRSAFIGGEAVPLSDTHDVGMTMALRRLGVATDDAGLSIRRLYGMGFGIVIAETERFGVASRRRLTVALDPRSCQVRSAAAATDRIRRRLNDLETGWGGPSGGTIVGSPRHRSSVLPLSVVIQVSREEG